MMYRKTNLIIAVLLATFLFITSCNKNPGVGLSTQPGSDLITANFIDTSTVLSYVIPGDTLNTSSTALMMIGSYVDPVMGKTTASVFTEFNLAGDAPGLDFTGGIGTNSPSDLKLDSAVLTLEYVATSSDGRRYYGSLDPQTIRVYPILQPNVLTPDSPYYSAHHLPFDSLHPIGSKTFIPMPDSNITLVGNYYPSPGLVCPPHVRIRIDTAFASKILHAGLANLSTSTIFHYFMPGFCIAPYNPHQPVGKGAVMYFDPHGAFTKLTFYYRREVLTPAYGDTLTYSFEINSNTGYYNYFLHNYKNTPVASRINSNSVANLITNKVPNNADYVYVQSAGGVRTLINLPFLKNYTKKGPIAVNQAQLVVDAVPGTISTNYNATPQLYLVAVDSSYNTYNYPVDLSDAYSNYGGSYNGATNQYVFNITRFVQAVLTGNTKYYGFYLETAGNTVNAQRSVLYGATKVNNKLRFRLSYTKLTH